MIALSLAMNKMRDGFFVTAFAAITLCLQSTLHAEVKLSAVPPFQDGDRVVFVGDSITRGGLYHSALQLFYATRFPERSIAGFNAGHSGGTAQDCLQRLSWDILEHKPTVAVVMFGMNDMWGNYGDASAPAAEVEAKIAERITQVQVYYEKLLDALAAANVRLILVGPSIYEGTVKLPAPVTPHHNLALTRWTERVREIAAQRQAGFVDLGVLMNPINSKLQATDPMATIVSADRVHPSPAGHLVMAYAILKAQGLDSRVSQITVDAATGQPGALFNCEVTAIERQGDGIHFTCTEKALPFVAPPGTEMGLNVVPFTRELDRWSGNSYQWQWSQLKAVPFNDDLNRETLAVANLASGRYELRIDDAVLGAYSAAELAAGINLSGNPRTPQYHQAQEVMLANEIRNAEESGTLRLKAFLRHALLEPAKVDTNDPAAVEKCLREAVEKRVAGDFARGMAEYWFKHIAPKWDERMKTYADAIAKIAQIRIPKPHRFSVLAIADSANKRQTFAGRDTVPELEHLVRELAAQLDLTRQELAEMKKRLEAGQFREALQAYRAHVLATLPRFDLGKAGKVDTATLATTELLLVNQLPGKDGKKLQLGEPWAIDWNGDGTAATEAWQPGTAQIEVFTPLLAAYRETGRVEFLDKWAKLADSWALFAGAGAKTIHERQGDEEAHRAYEWTLLWPQLQGVTAKASDPTAIPETTVARVLLKVAREYLPASAEYARYNPQNWTPHKAVNLLEAAVVFDALGFKAGAFHIRRAKRILENVGATFEMPDGSDSEQNFNYYMNHPGAINQMLAFLEKYRPELVTPEWKAELLDAARRRAKIMVRNWQTAPWATMPAGNRYGMYTGMRSMYVDQFTPLLADDPDSQAITGLLQGKADTAPPRFTSSCFPYSGICFIRSGWGKLDQQAYMFCSPEPGNSSWRADQGNNLFVLTAFGREMLIAGERCTYDSVPTPVKIDGKPEHFHWGVPEFNHRHKMRANWNTPAPMRWLDSPDFNFTEGLYAGPYGDEKEVLLGMRHLRQAVFVRRPGLWIITDRFSGNTVPKRVYEQNWWLPVKPIDKYKEYQAFDNERIVLDSAVRAVKTQDPGVANLSLYQFGPAEISYTKKIAEWGETDWLPFMKAVGAPRIAERLCVTARFEGEGDQAVVTTLYPRLNQETDLADIQSLAPAAGVTGFAASLPGGSTVRYLAAVSGRKSLSLWPVTVTGEGLLLTEVNGTMSGLALGVESFSFNGKARKLEFADFAFRIDDKDLSSFTPIYQPLAQVTVSPAENVFIGKLDVTLTAPVGCEIRYTTDGSEATSASPLYTQAVTLTESAMIVARAYRQGFAERAAEDPTFTGPAIRAVFTRQEMHPATAVEKPLGSLRCDYYEGRWEDLYQSLDTLKPVKTLPGKVLFDQTARATDGACAFRYSGYITVPEDGVYTYHAPAEQVWQHQISGYDLRVFVDGEEWYPATRRHAFGTWSIALQKGFHRFTVEYVDHRSAAMLALNKPEWNQYLVWPGNMPNLLLSGPGLQAPQPVATLYSWLKN